VHDVALTVLVALGAFAGTMVDNFVAYAAQLSLTDSSSHRRASVGQFWGVASLILIAAVVGTALGAIPLRWVGVLALVPLALAVHAWRHRRDATRVAKRGAITTYFVTVAFGGDNLAVWSPLFRAIGLHRGLITTGVFLVADVGLIVVARAVAGHPRVMALSQRVAPVATPVLYSVLAVVIAWECHWY
jgi:cadmium resistance protein CadD (predicted permease)